MERNAVQSQQFKESRSELRVPDPWGGLQTLNRIPKYSLFKAVALFITVAMVVCLAILIANMGGYVDEIRKWAIILETVFNRSGLGNAYTVAIGLFDTPVIVGNTVIYAYLLAITVFLLDFIYALVDPRVKVGVGTRTR